MQITIQEQSFSFCVEYAITMPSANWTATKKIFSLLPHITLQSTTEGVLATIEGKVSLIHSKYTIELSGRAYEYHNEKLWKGVDVCEGPGGPYHLYRHKGVQYSIFQGEAQIAAFSRNRLLIGNGKTYTLDVNAHADLPLLVSMVLCLNTENGDDREDSTVTYDFGNFGPEDRKFDASWRPTDETQS